MATVQSIKPLSSRTVEVMKPRDKIKADTSENAGLRVKCGDNPRYVLIGILLFCPVNQS